MKVLGCVLYDVCFVLPRSVDKCDVCYQSIRHDCESRLSGSRYVCCASSVVLVIDFTLHLQLLLVC